MHDIARTKLTELLITRGCSAASDPRLCRAYLNDACGNARAEITVLVKAAEAGIPSDLLSSTTQSILELSSVLAGRLSYEFGFERSLASWCVDSWALALGLLTPDDLPGTGGSSQSDLAGNSLRPI